MELTVTKEYLPTTVEDLNAFILIGKQKLLAHKAKIRAIEQTRMAIAAHEAALADAQDMADILLDAEVRMGEILDNQTSRGGSMDGKRGSERTLPPDITHKQSHQAQTLSRNQEIVEQAKAEARENGEIVTANKVYQIIKDKPVVDKDEESDSLFHLKRWWKRATKKDRKTFLAWIEEEEGK
jgi:hypothetical protein